MNKDEVKLIAVVLFLKHTKETLLCAIIEDDYEYLLSGQAVKSGEFIRCYDIKEVSVSLQKYPFIKKVYAKTKTYFKIFQKAHDTAYSVDVNNCIDYSARLIGSVDLISDKDVFPMPVDKVFGQLVNRLYSIYFAYIRKD